jgi:hypothetical protein
MTMVITMVMTIVLFVASATFAASITRFFTITVLV